MSTPKPSAAWFRIETDAVSVTALTKVLCSCGWKGRTRCGTFWSRTVSVERLQSMRKRMVISISASSLKGKEMRSRKHTWRS
jgi:hypothetical protein